MTDLLEIRTLQDLQRILQLQQSVKRQVTLELEEIIRNLHPSEDSSQNEALARIAMQQEQELLERYAILPTLQEHAASSTLRGAMQGGATFAVAAIVGDVLLTLVRASANVFPRVHRTLLMIMLSEFHKPVSEDSDLVDTFMRCMHVELSQGMQPLSEQERKRLLRSMLTPLAEAMVLVAERFGLMEDPDDEGYALTPLGERVMLHLFDSQRFIESVGAAHARLQQQEGAGKREAVTP